MGARCYKSYEPDKTTPPAQHAFWNSNNRTAWANNVEQLYPFFADPSPINGSCTGGVLPTIDVWSPAHFNATIPPNPAGSAALGAGITDDRYITVFPWSATSFIGAE